MFPADKMSQELFNCRSRTKFKIKKASTLLTRLCTFLNMGRLRYIMTVVFVCLLCELRTLRELLKVALSYIDHVVVIWRNSCGPTALG